MSLPPNESEPSKSDPLLVRFLQEKKPYYGYAYFHRRVLLEPSKSDAVLAQFLKLHGSDSGGADDKFPKESVAPEFNKFVRKIIIPALNHIDRDGLNETMQELIAQTLRLKLNHYFPKEGIDLLQSFLSTPTSQQRMETLSAFATILDQIDRRKSYATILNQINSEKKKREYNDTILENWVNDFCSQHGLDPLFVAYEILCACTFQIRCQARNELIARCDDHLKQLWQQEGLNNELEEHRHSDYGQKGRHQSRLTKLSNRLSDKRQITVNKEKCHDRRGGRASRFLVGLNTACLNDMLTLLEGHQNPLAKRVYVAILAKQRYLREAYALGEPDGKDQESIEQLLHDLEDECERLDKAAPCRKIVAEALENFKPVARKDGLAWSAGCPRDGMTDEQLEMAKRSQYGLDFYNFLENLIPGVLEKYPQDQWPNLRILLDSWLRTSLRGSGDRHLPEAGGKYYSMAFKDMKPIWQLATGSNPPDIDEKSAEQLWTLGVRNGVPVIAAIANATLER